MAETESGTRFSIPYGAETRVGERKILRYGQHHRVGQRCCQLVEFAHRHGADPRVETGEDVQNDALALQTAQGERSEVGFDQLEVGAAAPVAMKSPERCTGMSLNFVVAIVFLF